MSAPRNPPFPVFSNGRIVDGDQPVIYAEDQGFLLGLSVFDTVLFEHGCLFFVEEHLDRLRRGAEELAIPWPPPWDPLEALWRTGEALGGRPAALRLTLSRGVPGRGASLTVTARELARPPAEGVRVLLSSFRKLGGDSLEGVKSTNRLRNIMAREEAQARGAWEAILVNHEGDLSEGTISNLFLVQGQKLLTPSIDRGCLGGITRAKLLEDLERQPAETARGPMEVVLGQVDLSDLDAASEVFLTNSTSGVIRVLEVMHSEAGKKSWSGSGPVVTALQERFRAVEERYRRDPASLGAPRSAGAAPGP